ncbi:MAG: UDP-N-acetylmuramoyl-tripeptide--D-alanyl-D-alanine ligase [Candidatus Omnitrophota bacterium]
MDIKIREAAEAVGGTWAGTPHEEIAIGGISTDSRSIEKDELFFALEGERFDGHAFIKEAYEKGARHFVVSKSLNAWEENGRPANFIRVKDTLKAYGDLAKHTRAKFRIPAIAITGSSGKTTVKELVAHVLSERFQVLRNRGTENNLVGVPKTIFGLDASHEVLVLEMGTNHPGEIGRLSSIIGPQIGIVTQIGQAHLEGLKSREGVREEKLSVLNHIEWGGLLIVNGEDPMLRDAKSGVHKVLRAGFSRENADLWAERVWCHEKGASFYVEGELFESPLLGRHNILNCLYAVAAGKALGMDLESIRRGLASFKAVPGRLQFRNVDGIHFLDDTYNSNPESFRASLETLREFKIRERKGVVCGDMLELGEHSERLHRELGALAAELLFDFIIAAGPASKTFVDEALKRGLNATKIHHVKDSAEAGRLCRELARAGDRVLVKGSRGMRMERVFECFITSSIR